MWTLNVINTLEVRGLRINTNRCTSHVVCTTFRCLKEGFVQVTFKKTTLIARKHNKLCLENTMRTLFEMKQKRKAGSATNT